MNTYIHLEGKGVSPFWAEDIPLLIQYRYKLFHTLLKALSKNAPPPLQALPPQSTGLPYTKKDLSYDDLSKNIDANLAEIDMETFRSEDINSILALPAIYSGDFQSESRGEQCASVSGSLLNGLELDTSTRSNRHSEDEISICKDEPLFSPLREPPAQATISVDSLDNSSSYEQDLVLTCKANKNNYTIVFEGSSTQFSDDSDYQDVCRSSEGESSISGAVHVNYCSNFKSRVPWFSRMWPSRRGANSGKATESVGEEVAIPPPKYRAKVKVYRI
ncbi:iporin [Caerostris extrusa]|uniref:Iporin n=1 Tax=Caerostris extrusa TaxID=172846 RepID=A0AAV4XEH8_CAEEX|nr:iporin [Caerostris extrusa]